MVFILIRLVLMYLMASVLLGFIPVNHGFSEPEEGIEIYIVSNGVHTDFVLPMENELMDWREFFDPADFGRKIQPMPFIAFGWGDRGFYLNTPEWKDLTLQTSIKALFMPSRSAMHVTLVGGEPSGDLTRSVRVTHEQYLWLTDYIRDSFYSGTGGYPALIDFPGYGSNDLFFESNLTFHLFRTCNVWTNQGLKKTGIRTAFWTPFDRPMLYQLSRID